MGEYTCDFREIDRSRTVVLDIRKNGAVIKTVTGDSRENAILRARTDYEAQAERGKEAETVAMFLRTVPIDK